MKANEFLKNERQGLTIFKHALAQLSFKPKMFLVVYQYECEFVNEIKPNHGNCVFAYDDVKRLVESHELVEIHGYEKSKEIVANAPSDEHFYSWTLGNSGVRDKTVNIGELRKAIADVESCQVEGE